MLFTLKLYARAASDDAPEGRDRMTDTDAFFFGRTE